VIGLDTNLLLRCFVDDEPAQARQARQFVKERCTSVEPGHVDRVALCELIWVLSRGYRYDRESIANVVESLIASHDIVLEDSDLVRAALRTFLESGVGFADTLIGEVNRARGCDATATFDRKAAKVDGFVLVA
jgi:predicted nucleic-acid-binding protein